MVLYCRESSSSLIFLFFYFWEVIFIKDCLKGISYTQLEDYSLDIYRFKQCFSGLWKLFLLHCALGFSPRSTVKENQPQGLHCCICCRGFVKDTAWGINQCPYKNNSLPGLVPGEVLLVLKTWLCVCVCMCVNTEDRVTDFLFLFCQPGRSMPKSGSFSHCIEP